jgi:hypothetical protein
MSSGKLKVLFSGVALAFAAAIGVVVFATIGSAASGPASPAACLSRPQRSLIARGRPPEGGWWRVVGLLRNDAHCRSRMLEFNFLPFGHSGRGWGYGHEVSIGDSLSSSFVIASQYLEGPNEVAFGGITSRRGALVEFTTGDGAWANVRPQTPQTAGIAEPRWLRNVRYFLTYLPLKEKVKKVRVRDRAGRVIFFQGRESLGSFDEAGHP